MRRVTDKIVLTEKVLVDWLPSVEYVGELKLFSVMCAFKSGYVVWSDLNDFEINRRVCSIIHISADEFYSKFSPREHILTDAEIHRLRDDGRNFAIVCATTDIRSKTATRGSETWISKNLEGALIAWHLEACRTAIEMISEFSERPLDALDWTPPPLQTKRMVAERDRKLGRLFHNMGLELVGYMKRCSSDWHMIQKM